MRHGWPLAALLLVALLPGCALPSAVDESVALCAARAGSPARPYEVPELRALTALRGGELHEAQLREMLRLVAPHILTPDGARYERFEATLTEVERSGDDFATWRFDATGTWAEGRFDRYTLDLYRRGAVVGADFPDDVVAAPERLREDALASANASAEARELWAQLPILDDVTWMRDAPGCLRITLVSDDSPPSEGFVWVDAARGEVVSVATERDGRAA